jgi:hypothetical protein
MEKPTIEKELFSFSWSLFLFVSGLSSFVFSVLLYLLFGVHSFGFLIAGSVFLFLGILRLLLVKISATTPLANKDRV